MSKYVFDASTLILLAKCTLLRDIAKLAGATITHTVKVEVLGQKKTEDAIIVQRLMEERLITEVKEQISSNALEAEFHLGAGEAEALSFALKHNYVLATDDWRAIKACKALNIKFITAIHCLLYVHRKRIFDTNIAVQKLKKLEHCGRYNADIIKSTKDMLEGK